MASGSKALRQGGGPEGVRLLADGLQTFVEGLASKRTESKGEMCRRGSSPGLRPRTLRRGRLRKTNDSAGNALADLRTRKDSCLQ